MKKICNLLIELGIIALILVPPVCFGAVKPHHIRLIQMTIVGIGMVWAVKTTIKGSAVYYPAPLDLPFLLFLGIGVINLLTSTCSHITEREFFLVFSYFLLYFLVAQQLKTRRRVLGLTFILVLAGSGESLFGLIQYLQGATTVLGQHTPNIGTVNATYISHNHFAGFLVLVIPLVIGLFLGTLQVEKRLLLFLLLGIMGAAFVLSLSRGGLLSLGCAGTGLLLCLALKHWHEIGFWKIFIVLILLVGFIGSVIFFVGFSPIAHRSLFRTILPDKVIVGHEIRLPIWRNALVLVKEFPLFGSGLGTFGFVFQRYCPPEIHQNRQVYAAHNDYLELLIEMGIPALLLVLWGIYRLYRHVLNIYFRYDDPLLTSLLIGGLTSITAMAVHSFFDFNLQIPANAVLFVIVLALTTACAQLLSFGRRTHANSERHNTSYRIKAFSWKFVAALLLVVLAIVIHARKELAGLYAQNARLVSSRGDLFGPIEYYRKAIAIDGNNPVLHASLAEYYCRLGKKTPHAEKWYRLAAETYRKMIPLNRYDATTYYYLGQMYDHLNRIDEAIEMFRQAIAYNPRFAFYYEVLGKYYLSLGGRAQAIDVFRQALQLDPSRMEDILQTCRQRNFAYDELRQLVPEEADLRRKFAYFLARQHAWEESKQEYRAAIELSDYSQVYYDTMLQACRNSKDYQCMRELWQELWDKTPQNVDYPLAIARSFEQEQQWEAAIKMYTQLLDTFPNATSAVRRLAELHQQQGQRDEAFRLYTELLTREPANVIHYHHLAAMHQQVHDWDAAIAIYQQALDAGLAQAEIHSSLGALYTQTGQRSEAMKAYRQAFEAGEARMSVYKEAAALYRAQKNEIGLDFLWETYAFVNRHHPEKLFELVKHYHAQGEWLKAVTLAKEVIANAPTNTEYRMFLASLYEQEHMRAEANEQYRKILRIQPGHREAAQKLSRLGE
ncbi:hypothetical protein CSA56_12225 [candidate division KSB3 bacterium]|uniref:O-antigen ligase-related domain-containing protein n=1 Tax=candidate division KSB3 bacterium TaxID=2044937 RepID=A0A2G6KD76_9BACT|nr:MAG: hypothetical protein CSA56_12225 [candidate division KSB3 bacterium]